MSDNELTPRIKNSQQQKWKRTLRVTFSKNLHKLPLSLKKDDPKQVLYIQI
jgi:hypothetical protein